MPLPLQYLVMTSSPFREHIVIRSDFLRRLVALIVGLHGLFVIATTLIEQMAGRNIHNFIGAIDIDIPLLIGLGLIYLYSLLNRRKRAAWVVALLVYIFMIGFYANQTATAFDQQAWLAVTRKLIIPVCIIGLLLLCRRQFSVKSDIRSFGYAARFSLVILIVALIYGTTGFMLMDKHDFHREISYPQAVHWTVDQFGLTTTSEPTAHTKRAKLFLNSLSVVSIGAVAYAAISLFQPIRARYTSHDHDRAQAEALLTLQPGRSEDFFKLWPHDKLYFFEPKGQAGLAYKVQNGVALIVGDPFGERRAASRLLKGFRDLCYGNDWLPAFVHTEPDWSDFYRKHGFGLQKLGQEAIVDLEHFDASVRGNKYFRQIRNKFEREKFTAEVLLPPHDKALIARLQIVSNEWLERPGRAERGFMLGYFSPEYLQQSTLIVARDSAGTIQGFVNQIPSYDPAEANFDMLRHAAGSPGNINDFILMAFIDHLREAGFTRLNLGLSPLAGLEDVDDSSVITRAMRFMYSNGDRFYSFSGLQRFKAKYEPNWSDRYLAYPANARNFVKIMNALNRAMRVKLPKQK